MRRGFGSRWATDTKKQSNNDWEYFSSTRNGSSPCLPSLTDVGWPTTGCWPINIRLTGDFHQFGQFASSVAALPRIVTLHDISIQPVGSDSSELRMEVVAKTYRYLDEDEGG